MVFAYVQLGDKVVAPSNVALPGEAPWWVSKGWCPFPHVAAVLDPRILSDIARRLRGEPPRAITPAVPLPEASGAGL